MKKKIKQHLLLEQLEDRIFLSASPLAVAGGVDHHDGAELMAHDLHSHDTLALATEAQVQQAGAAVAEHVKPTEQQQQQDTSAPSAGHTSTDTAEAGHDQHDTADAEAQATNNDHNGQADVQAANGNTQQTGQTDTATPANDTTANSTDHLSDGGYTTAHSADDAALDAATGQETTAGQDATHENDVVGEDAFSDHSADAAGDGDHTTETAIADDAEVIADDDQAIDPMIGEDFTFTTTFNNTTGSDVFGPYIDLLLDGGYEGATTDAPLNPDGSSTDGITFDHATYLGANVESTVITITQNEVDNGITHPYATDNNGDPLIIHDINNQSFQVGDQFVSLRMPFGSFTTDQPAAEVQVTAHMGANADVDVDLGVHTTTGASLGQDALDNPTQDNPIRDISHTSTAYKPEVITYHKDIIVPNVAADCQEQHAGTDDTRYLADDGSRIFEQNHQEIPTGPNFPATYQATIDVADGQTVSGISLTEHLPDNIYYLGDNTIIVSVDNNTLDAGDYTITSPGEGIHGGEDLIITLNNDVDGTSGNHDVVIKYNFYVPDVLDHSTGNDAHIINNGEVTYSWHPNDTHDPDVNATINAEVNADGHFSSNPDVDDISHAQSIAIQKDHDFAANGDTGATGYSPGDTLDYTLDFQISDYFAFGDHDTSDTDYSFRIDDTVADGLVMQHDNNGDLTATIDLSANGSTYQEVLTDSGTVGDKMWTTLDGDNNLLVHYNLQKIFEGWGITNGILQGDIADGNGTHNGATHGSITYQADIGQAYHSEDNSGSGGSDNDVDQGDIIDGGVTITGDIYDNDNGSYVVDADGHAVNEADQSCDSIEIVTGSVSKDIYAINGTTGVGANPHISPGDTVTYHLHYDMPLSSTEDFHLTDYLPLPIFDADATGWTFDDPDNGGHLYDGNDAPDAGHWGYTTVDTYHTLTGINDPTVTANGGQNSLIFDWDPYHNQSGTSDKSTAIDIVFTVTASNEPFADGMFLTNQVRATEQGTPLADNNTDAIVQVVLDEPDLHIDKVAAPTTGVDAGDTVTFTVTVDNTGNSSAFDTIIKDTLPDGFDPSATAFTVTQGGTTLVAGTDFNWTGGGIDGDSSTTSDNFFADPGADGIYGTADDGNDGGIELIDGTNGQLHDGDSVVITYTLVASNTVQPGQVMTNTATITNFAGAEGATDHTTQDISDNATVTTVQPLVVKDVINTGETSTPGLVNVVIGETVQYTVTVTVPEGEVHDFHLEDTLDNGLAIVSIDSIGHGNLTTDYNGGNKWNDILTDAQNGLLLPGHNFSIDFGNVTNSDNDNDTNDEQIIITYTAVVLNTSGISGNHQNTHLDNVAHVTWDNPDNPGHSTQTTDVNSPDVIVQEADLQIIKEIQNSSGTWVDANDAANAVHYDQGDTIHYRITIDSNSTHSHENAFDAVFSDTLPAGLDIANATVTYDSGPQATWNYDSNTGQLTANWDDFDVDQTSVFLVTTTLTSATAGQVTTNTGTVTWESLDSDNHQNDGEQISPYNTNSGERTGDPGNIGGAANNYTDSDPAVISVAGAIDKISNPDPSEHTIGDIVSYTINVTLPDGTTNNLVVNDALPAGMTYVANSAQIIQGTYVGSDISSPAITVGAGDGGDISFDFGNISTDDAHNDDNTFTIQYTALVTNIDSNHGDPDGAGPLTATSLVNHASMNYTDPNSHTVTVNDLTDPIVNVVEPQITTTKDVSNPDHPSLGVLPGEVLTYTVRIENTGSSTAYEVTALDTLPTGVQLDSTDVTPSATYHDTSATSDSDATINITENQNGTLSFDSSTPGNWDIAVGDYITITYGIKVVGAGYVVGPHTNTIDADWTNRDGDPAQGEFERVYDDGVTQPQHTVDQTQDEDPATFTVLSNPPSLGDYVWFDQNGDGNQDADEPGISNVHVNLYQDADGDGTYELLATATTDADGGYLFSNVQSTTNTPPYKIMIDPATLPNGMYQTWENSTYNSTISPHDPDLNGTSYVEVLSNTNILDVDFGYRGINSVGDTVWFDVNGNGVQDTNEDGINGLSVTLHADIDGDGIAEYTETQTTRTINGVDGQYLFEHLPYSDMQNQPDFTITITPPAGSAPTYDQDGTTLSPDNTTTFDLDPNDTHLTDDNNRDDIDFGIRGTGSIGDYVWYDTNGDGNQNDGIHAGLGGVEVTLTGDIDNDGTTDYTVTTTTADDGSYNFGHLLGGTYTITVNDSSLPGGAANWNQTFDRDEGSSQPALDNTATDIVLAPGQNQDKVDFGYTGTGSLGDTVWYDANGNGVQEGTELGLAGVTVTISADVDGDGINEYTDTTVTDSNGNYHFDHLVGAEYTISVDTTTLPNGATPTYDLDSATSSPDSTTLYTLGVGENTDRVDFGYTGSGAIGDTVWNDINGDGIQQTGENGFGGVTVTLTGDLDHDGQADDTITTTTDANGHYSFDNLFLGAYTVAVDPATLPPGNSQTHDLDDPHSTTPHTPNSTSVTLNAANPVNNDADFGYNSKGTIGDTIWYDADKDGVQDPGELGLAGVTVTLTGDVDGDGNPDTVVATTDADGHYLFDQLQAGDYTIAVTNLPAGMSQTADPDGVDDNTTTLTLAGGGTNLDQDFGYTGTGTIGDTIWSDADGDGTQNNGETGLAGVTVTLTADLNNDGVPDTVTTTTDANGNYHFDNLPADNYTITVDPTTLPPGMQQTGDPDGTKDNSANVDLGNGHPMVNNDLDFGYQQTGTIGDTIWYDADNDGIQDPGELGLNGVTVTLTDAGGNTVATTTTSSDGKYLFDNLNAGDYTITLTGLPNGMTQTADPDGGNDNASHVTIGGTSPLVNLDQDFGYTGTGSIGDTIWNDVDGDGIQNNGETGLAGVSVTLTGDLNGDGNPDTVTVTTDSNGQYHFDRLPEGQYAITVDQATLPPGMQQTGDPDGGNDNTAAVTLLAGETNNDQDFGYQQTGTIGDTIWYDADGDGVQDPDELGLANVQVTLVGDLDGDGQADDTLTTVTDANGHYLFDKLPAGTYAITVDPATLPAGMEETFDLDGTGSADTAQVTIGDNEANLNVDFGYKGTGSIGDTIWYDADNDGVQDPGEAGIPGVTVTITGDFDNDGQADDTMTVTTGPDGSYVFPNLPAGEYDITVDPATLPGGMQPAGDPDGALDNTTLLSLTAGEINLDQDFGYTGTGSIGDQLWNDRNGNGVLDPGEAPLAGVQVCIGVDLDGDGTADYRATTTTGADGTYLFDNLPAGTHTICVNPATLPPGIRPSFDPDGTNDNATVVTLGAGEHNTVTDFGYAYPPPQPAPTPHIPVVPPVPPTPAPVPGFGNDPLLSYQQFSDREIDDIFLYPFRELPWQEPILPVSPIYTGHAEPGTTMEFTLYDVMGNQIGQQSVMADTAGNWLVDFPGTILYDLPHHMAITQTLSSYNVSSAGFFNMRTYFSPNFSSMVFSSTSLDVDTIFAYLPSTIMNSMHAGNMSTFNIEWNDFNEYEFFAPSTQPAETGH